MIQESYCSFEVSKLLKEKGFNAEISTFYSPKGELQIWCPEDKLTNSGTETGWWKCIAPTHQMAMRWLREVHNIHIVIECGTGRNLVLVYFCNIRKIRPTRIAIRNDVGYYNTYEETVEAALKYVLENLI